MTSTLRDHWRALTPMLLAVLFFGMSQSVDMFVSWQSLSAAQREIVGPLEEIPKTMGSFMVFMFASTLLLSVATPEGRGVATMGEAALRQP